MSIVTTSIAFIDTRVRNSMDLIAALDASVEVHILEAGRDGIEQIAEAVAGRTGIDALHERLNW